MAKNQSTYTLRIDAELGNLQQILSQAQSSLQSFMASGSAPKGLEKAFEKIRDLLGQIQDKTGKPLDLKGLASTGKSLDSVQESFSAIIRLLGDFNNLSDDLKLSFLGEGDRKKVEAVTAAMREYQKTLETTAAKQRELEAAQKKQEKDSGQVGRASKKVTDISDKKTAAEAKRSTKQGQLDALESLGDKADPVRVAKLRGEIGQLNTDIEQMERALQSANTELTDAQTALRVSGEEVSRLGAEMDAASGQALAQLKREAEKLGISLSELDGKEASEQIEILTSKMSELKAQMMASGQEGFEAVQQGCQRGGQAASEMGEQVQEATECVKQMDEAAAQRDAFEGKIKQFLGLKGAAHVLKAALRDAMATITELDATMTQMAVVTDLTVGDYWDQLPEYSKRASELGVSINSAYEAATLYYQQGLKTNEVVAISNETLKMAKIAGLDAADATDKMTAALRGFNMELNEASAQKIADVYSELAAITAADVDEISSAMTKTASIASSAGMEFETTAAFLSQIIETTRESAETAGTAMKTVIARFQELKKDPSEIGEIDGEIVDANAIETALRSVGVSLRDAQGQFRDLDDVFIELSSKWDSLDKNTQRYIATIAAGSRQQSRFIAMMSDYGRTQELVASANNSAGASQKQFEKTMESLSAKVEKLKNAWHEFTMGIMNSEFVKTGIDILTKLLEIINKATSALDGFGGSLTKISTILTVFKVGKSLFSKISDGFKAMWVDIIKIAIDGGEKAGEGALQGAQRAKQRAQQQAGTGPSSSGTDGSQGNERMGFKAAVKKTFTKEGAKQVGSAALSTVGASDVIQGAKTMFAGGKKARATLAEDRFKGKSREDLQANIDAAKAKRAEYSVDAKGGYHKKGKKGGIKKAEYDAGVAAADEEIKAAEKNLADYDKAQEDVINHSKDGWNQMAEGIGKAGMALTGAGMAVTGIGQAFIDAGYEEFGEGMQKVGGIMTTVGSITSLVSMGMSILSAIFPVAGTAGTASGIATNLAWSPISIIILIIVAALAVMLIAFLAIMAIMKKNSAAEKLKEAEAASERAAQAAEHAAESYEKLVDALDGLKDKYKNIENLTKGTKEWNEAMLDINNSVLDLVDQYPELMKYVTTSADGVLQLDTESTEVQAVLKEKQAAAVAAKTNALYAKNEVNNRKADLSYSELDVTVGERNQLAGSKWGSFGVGAAQGAIATGGISPLTPIAALAGGIINAATYDERKAENDQTKKDTDALAQAIATGKVKGDAAGIADYLQNTLGYSADEAGRLADELAQDVDKLADYGMELENNKAYLNALNESAASAAKAMADLSGLTEEQQKQANNMIDGDVYDRIYKEQEVKFEEDWNDLSKDEKEQKKQEIIEKQYGEGARLEGDKVYLDGQEVASGITEDDIKQFGLSQAVNEAVVAATEGAAQALENAKITINSSTKLDDSQKVAYEKALDSFYAGKDGGALTKQEQEDMIKLLDSGVLKDNFNENSELKAIYGSYEEFEKTLKEGADAAKVAFEEAGDAARDFMTADMATAFKEKLDEVAKSFNGEANRQIILEATDVLMASGTVEGKALTDDQKQAIQDRIDMTDWTNLEDIKTLQLDLIENYNMSAEAARAYTTELANAANATSSLLTTIDAFGALHQATKQVESALKRVSELQWEYSQALAEGSDNTEELMLQQLEAYQNLAEGYKRQYQESTINLGKIGAQAYDTTRFGGIDLSKYFTIREDGSMDTSNGQLGGIQDALSRTDISEETRDAIKEYVESYNSQWEEQQEALDGLRDTVDDIQALEAQGEEAFYELRSMVQETIVGVLQEQIDLQQATLDATNNANSMLISKIQEQIDDNRQARQNEEAEKNIANLQSQAAYLGMDTSGANNLAMVGLEDQIAQAEQDYQDSLVDQALQNLSDANEEAAQQRERQINIAQMQLEAYQLSAEFQQQIDEETNALLAEGNEWQNTEFGQQMYERFTEGLSGAEASKWQDQVTGKIGTAEGWKQGAWGTAVETIKSEVETLPEDVAKEIENSSKNRASQSQASDLTTSGFNLSSIGISQKTNEDGTIGYIGSDGKAISDTEKGKMNKLTEFAAKDDAGRIKELQSQADTKRARATEYGENAQARNYAYLSQQDFYSQYSADIAEDGKATIGNKEYSSYTEYLEDIAGRTLTGIDNLTAMEAFGGHAVSGDRWYLTSWSAGHDFDIKIAGENDNVVDLGDKAGSGTAKRLEYINNQTGGTGYVYLNQATSGKARGVIYMRESSTSWWPVKNQNKDWSKARTDSSILPAGLEAAAVAEIEAKDTQRKYTKYKAYETGGIADFTGPAWLDGTPTKPEYILNAQQTERFFSLVDVLEGLKTDGEPKKTSGDNYFDINISVEKIEDDYDVEQMADKIRRMIYDDATYRNVNAINHIR